jgi:hypothetical protein
MDTKLDGLLLLGTTHDAGAHGHRDEFGK